MKTNEMNEKKKLIMEYITKTECQYMCDENLYQCESCSSIEECFTVAHLECICEFAEVVDYGGYDNVEDFLVQLYD